MFCSSLFAAFSTFCRFPQAGAPRQSSASLAHQRGNCPDYIIESPKKIGARDEQRVSANSTYALFARWEMSKRKNKAFAVPERGGTFPLAARDAGSPKSRRFSFVTRRKICESFFTANARAARPRRRLSPQPSLRGCRRQFRVSSRRNRRGSSLPCARCSAPAGILPR